MPPGPGASRLLGGWRKADLGPRSGQPRPASSGQAPTEQEIPPVRPSPGHLRAVERSSGETEGARRCRCARTRTVDVPPRVPGLCPPLSGSCT